MINAPTDINKLKAAIEAAGIVGAGGGGFPSHLKIDSRIKTILLNCAECEPLLQVDQQLLANFAKEILTALNHLAKALNATAIVVIKKSYTDAIHAVTNELKDFPNISISLLGETYPAGDEVILIYEALGIVVPPGGLPIDANCVVFNTETIYNMYLAFTHNQLITHKWITIVGEVKKPTTVYAPIGTSIIDAVQKYSGGTNLPLEECSFISGGPMMGKIVHGQDKIDKTTKAIIVLPTNHCLVQKNGKNSTNLNRVASACCQCRTCTDMCPRYLLGHPIEPHRIMRAMADRNTKSTAFNGAMYCSLCGLCETIACPQSLAPRSLIHEVKNALSKEGIKPEKCHPLKVELLRSGRQVSVKRLKLRLDLTKYDVIAPMQLMHK